MMFFVSFVLGLAADQATKRRLTLICDLVPVLGAPAVFFGICVFSHFPACDLAYSNGRVEVRCSTPAAREGTEARRLA
jgi:hypothetical protein